VPGKCSPSKKKAAAVNRGLTFEEYMAHEAENEKIASEKKKRGHKKNKTRDATIDKLEMTARE
jgi:hypothetical protein